MNKKIIGKILLIAFVACLGTIIMSKETQAATEHTVIINGAFNMGDIHISKGYASGTHIFGSVYHFFWFGYDENGVWRSGSGYYYWVNPPKNKISYEGTPNIELQSLKFGLLPGDVLQVTAPVDAKCDVYVLETGRLVLQDVDVAAGTGIIPVKPSNMLYLIQFKVDGKVVYQQRFLFNNSNSLSIGGENE